MTAGTGRTAHAHTHNGHDQPSSQIGKRSPISEQPLGALTWVKAAGSTAVLYLIKGLSTMEQLKFKPALGSRMLSLSLSSSSPYSYVLHTVTSQ